MLGRKIEMIAEDSVNPSTAVTKAQKLIERDKVSCIIGEISSASALAIGEQALRYKTIFVNTGANSDALRGTELQPLHVPRRRLEHDVHEDHRHMAEIEQTDQGTRSGTSWWPITRSVTTCTRCRRDSSGKTAASMSAADMIADQYAGLHALHLKIRQAQARSRVFCLAGVDLTTFLKQYREYNLPFTLSGGAMDTVLFWGAGTGFDSGHWQSLWYHGLTNAPSRCLHQTLQRQVRQAARKSGMGRLCRDQDHAAGHGRDQGHRHREDRGILREGRELRYPEAAQGQRSAPGTTSCCRKCTWSGSRTRRR